MNKIYKIKILIICFAFFYSCSKSSEKINYLICKDSIQYWNYNMISKQRNIWFTFSFDKNGNVKKYSFYKGKRWLFEDYPNKPDLKWSVSNDSIFRFLGVSEKITKICNDTIFSVNIKSREKNIYYRVKGNLNIQQADE